MQFCRRALSILLSVLLLIEVDGCNKKQVPANQAAGGAASQPPPTTYATPTADQLYQLVAPIALFPDNLLAQVLAGSTFPDQITAAYQWVQQNSGLSAQQSAQAADQQPWDASVKGLTQFPDVLKQMATNLTWTSSLGDAYFNIPQSVMNAVQVMRQRAQQAGTLKTNQQQTVSVQNQPPGEAPPAQASSGQAQTTIVQPPPQTIVIQPSQPDVVYVPTYNPTVVYGAPVPAYPGYSTAAMVTTSLLSFGVGIAVGAAMSGGCCGWGYNSWGCGWHNSSVTYNRNVYVSNSNTFVNRNNYYNRNNINANNINTNNINRNNFNGNNVNRNNINGNNINRNNVNGNNLNRNNRTDNFRGNNFSTPTFNQNRNEPQFRNTNANNLAQQRGGTQSNLAQNRNQGNLGQQRTGTQPTFNQNRDQAQFRNQNQGSVGQNRAGTQPNFNQDRNQQNLGQQRGGSQPNFGQNQPRANNTAQRTPERGYGQQASSTNGRSAFGNYGEGGNARTNSARGQQSLGGGGGGGGASRPASAGREGGGRPAGGRPRR